MMDEPAGTTEGLEAIRRAALAQRGIDPNALPEGSHPVVARFFMLVAQLAAGAVAVLIGTGIALLFVYRPTVSEELQRGADGVTGPSLSRTLSELHEWAGWAAAVLLVIWVLWATMQRLRVLIVAIPTAACFAIGISTGYRIAWDQFVITNDLFGERLQGVWPVFRDGVVAGVFGDGEVGASSLRWLVVIHGALGVVTVLSLIGVAVLFDRSRAVEA